MKFGAMKTEILPVSEREFRATTPSPALVTLKSFRGPLLLLWLLADYLMIKPAMSSSTASCPPHRTRRLVSHRPFEANSKIKRNACCFCFVYCCWFLAALHPQTGSLWRGWKRRPGCPAFGGKAWQRHDRFCNANSRHFGQAVAHEDSTRLNCKC